MKKKKYQIGGIQNLPTVSSQPISIGGVKPKPNSVPLNDISLGVSEETGDLTYHPLFKLFNLLAQGVTGVANRFSDIDTDKRNRLITQEALQNPNFRNTTQDGLNQAPAYYKAGGKNWIPKNLHKGRCADMGSEECPKGSPQYNLAKTFKKHHGFHKKQTGGRLIKDSELESYKQQGYIPIDGQPNYYRKSGASMGNLTEAPTTSGTKGGEAYDKKLIALLQDGNSIDDLATKGYGTPTGLQKFAKYYKPTEDIVYTQPQQKTSVPTHLNMNQRMFDENGHAIGDYGWQEYKGTQENPGGRGKFANFQPIDASGNPTKDYYENIPESEWSNIFAEGVNRLTKDKLTQLSKYKKMQAGGNGNSAELEEGEIHQTANGEINKVPDDAGTHEEGGVEVTNVERVLEDTSDKRKDKASKLLKIQPKTVEALLGFKPKTSLSHSKAHEKAIEFYNKKSDAITNKLVKNHESREENDHDKYALNSMKFNVNNLSQLPSEQDMFDTLFDHQEKVKELFGIQDNGNKKQAGGLTDYSGAKTKKGRYTPTGADVNNKSQYLPLTQDEIAAWEKIGIPVSKMKVADAQAAMYDWTLKNNPAEAASMWRKFGNTAQGLNKGILKDVAPTGNFSGMSLSPEQLQSLAPAYNDNKFAVRRLYPEKAAVPENIPVNRPIDTTKLAPMKPLGVDSPAVPQTDAAPEVTKANGFNYPLKWYDVAGPLEGLINDTKAHVGYNPQQVHQLEFKQYNALPQLQQGQSDYNAELAALASTGVNGGAQLGNMANLYARKYALNNQVIGNTENQNVGVKNSEIQYNTQAADRQSALDAQSRESFEQKVLGTDEALRQQRRTDQDALYTRIAQNKKFNFEGNLLMKLFPNFNSTGDYNGKRYNFRNPLNSSGSQVDDILIKNNINPQGMTEAQKATFLAKLMKVKK